jgi:hypothetical protein
MIPIKGCSETEVWDHWKKVEKVPVQVIKWRWDIRGPLIDRLGWFLAEIEESDLEKIYIISSSDWIKITPSFKLLEAVANLEKEIDDEKIENIKIKRSIFQNNIDGLDRRLFLVSPTVKGNFTIIEGNKRAVALQSIGRLVGTRIYLGISPLIENYGFAQASK